MSEFPYHYRMDANKWTLRVPEWFWDRKIGKDQYNFIWIEDKNIKQYIWVWFEFRDEDTFLAFKLTFM